MHTPDKTQNYIKLISDISIQYQKHIVESLKNVKIDVEGLNSEQKLMKDALGQLYTFHQIAASKESEEMNNEAMEKLGKISERVGIAEANISHISSDIREIKESIKSTNAKIDRVLEKLENTVTKTELKEKFDTMKWFVGVMMAVISVIAGVVIKMIP